MNIKLKTIIVPAMLLAMSCSHRKVIKDFDGQNNIVVPNVATFDVSWVKDKKKGFDTEIWITNVSKTGILIPVDGIDCSRAGYQGTPKLKSFDAKNIDLSPGEKQRFILICKLDIKQRGEFELNFKNIAERAANGGSGKILAEKTAVKLNKK